MNVSSLNWPQVEAYLKRDCRCVLPLGCTEQHAYLSLATDNILAERVAQEAAEPLGVPVFPVVPYGSTPIFMSYPGTVSLRIETLLRLMDDILSSLAQQGFTRIVIVNGHGGNAPVGSYVPEWMAGHPGVRVKFWNWWNAPQTWAAVQAVDPLASHASWMENFPWTRIAASAAPPGQKPMADFAQLKVLPPEEVRKRLGDGNCGGSYIKSDEAMAAIWKVAVRETAAIIESGWDN